jgi:hypothetical protein
MTMSPIVGSTEPRQPESESSPAARCSAGSRFRLPSGRDRPAPLVLDAEQIERERLVDGVAVLRVSDSALKSLAFMMSAATLRPGGVSLRA